MQSESVELWILLSWSDELTIYTLLPLHRAFHVARTWPNSKINEILYRPSIVPGGGAEQVCGDYSPPKPPVKPPLDQGMLPNSFFFLTFSRSFSLVTLASVFFQKTIFGHISGGYFYHKHALCSNCKHFLNFTCHSHKRNATEVTKTLQKQSC